MSLLEKLRRTGRGRFEGRPARRPGGARRYLMEELEPRAVLSGLLSGTDNADTSHIRRDPGNPADIQVRVTTGGDVILDVSLELASGCTLTVNAGDGDDVINVHDTLAGVFLVVDGQGDRDTL